MRINVDWLSEFCELPALDALCQNLVSSGIEVEGIFDPVARLQDVRVAQVVALAPHPAGDRLQICQLETAAAPVQVVCGAANVAVGARVAWAPPGARLGAVTLSRRSIRGVDSDGMLCSRSELGLANQSEGIWLLPADAPLGVGVAVAAALPLVLTLAIPPNRPDLLAHVGVAREVAAANSRRVWPNKWRLTEKGPDVSGLARVIVDEASACRRYVGRVVRGLKVGPSPAWLQARLESIGQRSINNVVDVTNYVMFELGQPLHAYNLSRLAVEGGLPTLRVRQATADETLQTLDGVVRQLSSEDLVVADALRPLALAGVMGGADTEVQGACVQVLIEGAAFAASRVRQMARRHGLRSEAAQRFERGVDPTLVARAVERCAQLLAEVAEGEVAKGVLEFAPKLEPGREIPVRLERIQRLLGIPMGAEVAVQLLEPLEIRCVGRTDAALIFAPPSARADLQREVDLIEELARRHGYERIPSRLPDAAEAYRPRARQLDTLGTARQALLSAGCSEVVTYGIGRPGEQETPFGRPPEAPLLLQNPLGEELSALRTGLMPGLLRVLRYNLRHGASHLRLFEMGSTFHPLAPVPEPAPRSQDMAHEVQRVACLMRGGRAQGRWYEAGAQVDFADLAGVLEHLREALGHGPLTLRPLPLPGLSPSCSAGIFAGSAEDAICLGWAGSLDPVWLRRWDIDSAVYAAELDLTALVSRPAEVQRASPLPRHPASRRDVALVLPRSISVAAVQAYLQEHAGGVLGPAAVARIWPFDVYVGQPMAPTEVSVAFAVLYRHPDRTLTEAEVATAFQAAVQGACQTFAARLR